MPTSPPQRPPMTVSTDGAQPTVKVRASPSMDHRLMSVVAWSLALGLLAVGFWLYATQGQEDLRLRWLEKLYVLNGVNPLDALSDRPVELLNLPALGRMAGYAPWSYVYAILFAPSGDASVAVAWFAVLNLAAWAMLMAFGWRTLAELSPDTALPWIAAAAAVTFVAIPVVLRHGNYGLIVAALLAGMVWLLDRDRPWLAGFCLGLAMVKPQLAALFCFVPLTRGRVSPVLVAAMLVCGAWLVAAFLTSTSPLRLLAAMLNQGAGFGDAYQGVFAVLRVFGISGPLTTVAGMAVGAGIVAWLCWRNRDLDLVTIAAIPAVVATIWAYHRTHDLMILSFLGLAAIRGLAAVERRPSAAEWVLLLAPWWPYLNRMNEGYLLPTAFRALWFASLLVVLARARIGQGALPMRTDSERRAQVPRRTQA